MRKELAALLVCLVAVAAKASTYYGFKIGGVAVTSDNCHNVKGSNIKANVTSEPYSVSYDPTTNTVTLKNVKIERTGNDNRCIFNESCDGLTVYFSTENSYLSSTTCAPIRLNASTTFTCEALVRVNVHGNDGDANALYAANGATVTFDHATFFMYVDGNSNPAVSCSSTTGEKLVIHHSRFYAQSANGSALSRFSSVRCDGSAVILNTNSSTACAMSEVSAFTCPSYPAMKIGYDVNITNFLTYTYFGEASFSSSQKTFVNLGNDVLPGKDIIISQRIPIDETNFPDAAFRSWLAGKYGSSLETFEIFQVRTINVEAAGSEVLANVHDWTGIHNLACLRRLWVQGGNTELLRLYANKEFYHLKCYDNIQGFSWAGLASSFNPVPSGKEGLIEGFNATAAEHAQIPYRSQLAEIKTAGFDFIVKNGNVTYSLHALEDYCPIDFFHFPDDAFRTFLYSRAEGLDAVLHDSENATIHSYDLKNLNIADLKGIEAFTNLTHLYVYQNRLSTLYLNKNTKLVLLYCYWNKIKSEGWEQFIANAPTFSNRLDVYCYYPSSLEQNDPPTWQQVAQANAKNIHFYQRLARGWEEMSDTPPMIPGDVNGDGFVTSADVTAIYDVLLGIDTTFEATADVNGDGFITSADVTAVYDILLGN